MKQELVHTYICNSQSGGVKKLEWQDDKDCTDKEFTYKEALKYAEDKGNGWRLPTLKELKSIVNYSKSYPAVDERIFENVASSHYWSSTSYASSPKSAWVVTFYNGTDYWSAKSSSYFVRCVRTVKN